MEKVSAVDNVKVGAIADVSVGISGSPRGRLICIAALYGARVQHANELARRLHHAARAELRAVERDVDNRLAARGSSRAPLRRQWLARCGAATRALVGVEGASAAPARPAGDSNARVIPAAAKCSAAASYRYVAGAAKPSARFSPA